MKTINKKIVIVLMVLAVVLIGAIFVKSYGLKNVSFLKNANKKITQINISDEEKLKSRYEEMAALGENEESDGRFYDLYVSPESKQRMTKEQYIKNKETTEKFLKKKIISTSYDINSITIKGDTGYIDRTLTLCFNQECTDSTTGRGYKKYIKINNEWFVVFDEKPVYCIRENEYEMPDEFKRALNLITQRYKQHGDVGTTNSLESIKNCLKIEYSESGKEINGAEGVFVFSPSHSLDEYTIKVSPKYSIKDDLLTAVLLSHELTHVFQYANNNDVNSPEGCYGAEADAFVNEGKFVYAILNSEERNSLESRINSKSYDAAQLFQTFLIISRYEGDLIGEKALNFVKSSKYYQQQCEKK